jgi:hypothetical protein
MSADRVSAAGNRITLPAQITRHENKMPKTVNVSNGVYPKEVIRMPPI